MDSMSCRLECCCWIAPTLGEVEGAQARARMQWRVCAILQSKCSVADVVELAGLVIE